MNYSSLYWWITGFLLLWGIAYAGLVVFSFLLATPEHWATLVDEGRIKAEYAAYISEIPGWVIVITMLAAATRLLGGVALVMHSSWAAPMYGISLCLVIAIMFRGFVLANVADVIRTSQIVLEFTFLVISVFAVWYASIQMK